jgi:hypothetical protein
MMKNFSIEIFNRENYTSIIRDSLPLSDRVMLYVLNNKLYKYLLNKNFGLFHKDELIYEYEKELINNHDKNCCITNTGLDFKNSYKFDYIDDKLIIHITDGFYKILTHDAKQAKHIFITSMLNYMFEKTGQSFQKTKLYKKLITIGGGINVY